MAWISAINNRFIIAGAGVFSVVAIIFLILNAATEKSSLDRIMKDSIIRVGYSQEAPYSYIDSRRDVAGESPDTARAVLKIIGINKIDWRLLEFGSLIPELQAGRIDMIASGMFITKDRREKVLFSNPVLAVKQGMLVRMGNPKNIHGYIDIANHPDAVLAVLEGAVEHDYAKSIGLPDSRIIAVPDALTGVAAVKSNRADCLALSRISISSIVKSDRSGQLEEAHPFVEHLEYGIHVRGYTAFAFRRQDDDLASLVNSALERFRGSDEHLRIIRSYGFYDDELFGKTVIRSEPAR
ncbi:MAG: ectoine/hydroxyectoine ABC transporter substrate-binding protein EhuB [Nitrospirae bacterium]|nr:ectoine/hydroxyectoine ABC transporter substrate-binding protein EhuB [Nitrospirota bacterium]